MQGVIFESLESRTLFSAAIAGELLGTLPQSLLPAASDHLTLQISNTGDARAKGPVKVALFDSPSLGIESVLVGRANHHLNLAPGRSTQFNLKFKLPRTLADGQYFLTAQLSSPRVQTVAGSMSQTISDASPFSVQPPAAAFTGNFAGSPIKVGLDTSGDDGSGTVSLRIINTTADTLHGPVTADIYLSTSKQLNSAAQAVGTLNRTITVPPGRSRLIRGTVTIPASTDFGTYHLLAELRSPAGVPTPAIFATQLITIDQGPDTSTLDNTNPIDTGGDDGGFGEEATSSPAPTTQDNGESTTQPTATQPTTDPGDIGGDDGGDDSGDDGGGDDSGDC
jgi:hypothetical protein